MLIDDVLASDGKNCTRDVAIGKLENRTVLLTGASGLIGTHFLFALHYLQTVLRVNVKVIAIVNRGIPEHLVKLSTTNAIQFIQGDLAKEAFVCNLPQADVIVHAATYGQPGMFMDFPESTIKLNTYVTAVLLERVLKKNGKFLFISSSEVYSGLTTTPFLETKMGSTTPDHPRACYIEAKRCGEAVVNVYRNKGCSATSARLSLAYGPGTRRGDRRVINNFVEKALLQKEIVLLDNGEAKRTYCYVSDAVNMMLRILLEGKEFVYNVGGVSSVTIADLARLVGKIVGVNVIFPQHKGGGDSCAPDIVQLDIARYTAEFGEREFVSLETGVRNIIEWQKNLYNVG